MEDRETIDAALDGDRAATKTLVARLRPVVQAEVGYLLLRHVSGRRVDPRQEVQDLVQDVFVALWERDGTLLRRWDPTRGRTLESYARLVARSRALDRLRSRGYTMRTQTEEVSEEVPQPDASARVVARDRLLKIQGALRSRLSSRDHFVFFAVMVEDRPPADVAHEAGMSAAAVYQLTSRLRRQVLPQILEELDAAGNVEPAVNKNGTGDEKRPGNPVGVSRT